MRRFRLIALLCALFVLAAGSAPANPVFTFTWGTNIGSNAAAQAGFQAAAARWSSLFSDNVNISIRAELDNTLPPGALGSSNSSWFYSDYSFFKPQLVADAKTADDLTATSNLQAGPLKALMNWTSDNPNAMKSGPFLDSSGSNNEHVAFTSAEARALGYTVSLNPGQYDARITFNSNPADGWDYDPTDGVSGYDFIGVATHELGHVLGFRSGVDDLDSCFGAGPGASGANRCYWDDASGTRHYSPDIGSDQFPFYALDLFRYSSDSVALDALDWTADARAKYFSLDGGATDLAAFATGMYNGDGRQASHWKRSTPRIGIMDPTVSKDTMAFISETDVRALDVIGWDPVPEPSSLGLTLAAAVAALWVGRRRPRRNG